MLSKRAARRRILFPYLSHCKETCEYANSGTMDDGLRVVMLDAMKGVMNIAYTIMFCVFFPSTNWFFFLISLLRSAITGHVMIQMCLWTP
jgi:hypothetical protein